MAKQAFVARERELAQLQAFLDRALAGQGQICFVTGEAGAGKTALVTEFARRAQENHAGLLAAVGDCNAHTGLGDPYLPFREVLGLLTGDVEAKLVQGTITQENASRLRNFLRISGQALVDLGPDLIDVFVPGAGVATRAGAMLAGKIGWLDRLDKLTEHRATGPGETDLEQSHIFEQYTNVLQAFAVQQPLMLMLDDLQWADAASISLLFHLGRRIGESRTLIVGAYRPDEVAMGRGGERHPLEKVLAEFKRYHGDVWVDLGQAEQAEGRLFVDAVLDTEPNRLGETFRQALSQHTGGHPLFTIELLRDMQARGDLVQDEEGRWIEGPALDWGTLPARAEGVIEERIGRLEGELRETLAVASVEGEDFTAQVIARVREVQERRLLRALSRDLEKRHHLVRDQGELEVGRHLLSRFQFAHTLFQQYLYNDLSAGERRLLHGEIAEVLEDLYAGRTDEITVQLAHHYAQAREGEKAVEYLLRAGDRARKLYAYQEAIDSYQRALSFLEEQRDYERAARTLMKLGLTHHIAFEFQQARQAYEEGFTLWQRAGEIQPAVPLPPAPHALRLAWGEPLTLDPAMAVDGTSSSVTDQLFSGLVEHSLELDVVPDVARSWKVLEGGQKYVFHLRDDVRWSDSIPVTADDFEYAWKRVLNPATGSPLADLLYDVKGARAFHQGEVPDPDQVGVRALDAVTLIVELERPTGYFLHLLADPASYPVPRQTVEAHGAAWTEVENIVTNGPFKLEVWQRGNSMVLVRNPKYHGRFMGNIERVKLSLLADQDPSALLRIYETDNFDSLGLGRLPPPELDRARQRHAGEYVAGPALQTWYVGFDVSRPPFNDPRVRRAFAHATDREALADVILRGYQLPATGGLVPPGMPGHSPGVGLSYDPEQARHFLAEAGYPGGRGFPTVSALAPDLQSLQGEYLQTRWREILGIEIPWEVMGWSVFLDTLDRELPQILILGWLADYPDPDNFLRGSSFQRHTNWKNEAYNMLIEKARQAIDQERRLQLYGHAEKILIEEAAIIPLTYWRTHRLVKPWVRKYPTSAIKSWFWKDVTVEPH